MIPCKIDAEGKNTGTIITISYTWRQGILFYEENFLVKNTYSACNTLYCLWKKKEQEPFEEFSMWKVLNALSTNRPEQIKELLQPQLQQQSDIDDQLNSICRFVSGIPKKKEIKSKSESRKYYNMNGNLEKEIIEFNVNFKTRANNPYQMKIKWCEYSPKKPDDKGICFLSVRYLGKTEKNLQGKVRTYAEIK